MFMTTYVRRLPRSWNCLTILILSVPLYCSCCVLHCEWIFTCLINKLQIDPSASSESLQKTSPKHDPAAIYQLTTELSAQAQQLAAHHHQLQKLTSLTEDLVKTLQSLHLHAAAPSASPTPAVMAAAPTPPTSVNPRLAFPERFDGSPSQCRGFLLQCTLFVNQQPALYPTEEGKISFVCSLLTGRALEWITAVWSGNRSPFLSFEEFLQRFREVFDHPKDGRARINFCLPCLRARERQLIMPSSSALSPPKLLGRRIRSRFTFDGA